MSWFIDGNTEASRPAHWPIDWLIYFRSYPKWPVIILVALVCSVLFVQWHLGWLAVALGLVAAALLYLNHIRAHFRYGMLCPAVVLRGKPLLIGVLTDLGNCEGSRRLVLKVIAAPPRARELAHEPRLAAVLLYSGTTRAAHWADCHPKLALSANRDRRLHRCLLERIPPAEWHQLAAACARLSSPVKTGLYPVELAEV